MLKGLGRSTTAQIVFEKGDGSELKLINVTTKQVMPTEIKINVLDMETLCRKALWLFIDKRTSGDMNTWDKMPKPKFLSWKDGCKTVKFKASSKVMRWKATNSLFVRMLLIAISSGALDLEEI